MDKRWWKHTEINIYVDESGNLGIDGEYFVIACCVFNASKEKPVKNFMRKAELKVKTTFDKYKDAKEIKAGGAYPVIKDYYYRNLAAKDFDIYYIVAKKSCIEQNLKKDKNTLYSYLMHFLILKIVSDYDCHAINIVMDNHSIKTQSKNSFADYIKIKVVYEMHIDCNVNVRYVDSSINYMIQVADFVANAVFLAYENNDNLWLNYINNLISHEEKFPRKCFKND